MSNEWIVNASPLIVLAKAERLPLWEQMAAQVLVPIPVADEILSGPATDSARQALEAGWGTRITTGVAPAEVAAFHLDAGECADTKRKDFLPSPFRRGAGQPAH